jgi:hypothetical protein
MDLAVLLRASTRRLQLVVTTVRTLAHAEWLALLLDREAANRNTKRFQTRLPVCPAEPWIASHPS